MFKAIEARGAPTEPEDGAPIVGYSCHECGRDTRSSFVVGENQRLTHILMRCFACESYAVYALVPAYYLVEAEE